MSKYSVGQKFIIEIDSRMTNKRGDLYGIKGFNALVFDDNGLDKLERYEAKQDEINVGDEIEEDDDKGVVTYVNNAMNTYQVIWFDGSCGDVQRHKITKTGRHYDIDSILEQMRGE